MATPLLPTKFIPTVALGFALALAACGGETVINAEATTEDPPAQVAPTTPSTTTTTTSTTTTTTSTTTTTISPEEQLILDVVAAAEAKTSYRTVAVEVLEDRRTVADVTVVDYNSHSLVDYGAFVQESMWIDGILYQIEDDTAYERPVPEVTASGQTFTLGDFAEMLVSMPSTEVDRTASTVTYELHCSLDDLPVPLLARICNNRIDLHLTIDLRTARISTFLAEGLLETYPGEFQTAKLEIFIENETIDALTLPETVDSTRAACIGEAVGFTAVDAIAVALNDTTTEENHQIYTGCGFDTWPPGSDLRD